VPIVIALPGDKALKSAATGANLVKEEQNWINITPDILSSSGNLNISWNFTNWDKSKFPDCYVRIYGYMHTPLIAQMKMVNPSNLNKTGNRQIAYTGFPTGAYFLNLQCETLNGEKNTTVSYESINLDIVPVIINSTARTKTARDAGMQQVQDYVTCKNMPGVNCPEWQQLAAQGRSWNISLGVPI
jgi:hypothetical protein